MNEEIEYAEMLEIPVSTVNVVQKKRRVRGKGLKEKLIARINGEAEEEKIAPTAALDAARAAAAESAEEGEESGGTESDYAFRDEGVETVRLSGTAGKKRGFFAAEEYPAAKRSKILLTAEFALACLLCGGIFLTNVFMPNSAINTFFRSLMPEESAAADERNYTDFDLGSVVGEFSDAELELSPAGVLSFTAECCVYPAADGTVGSVTANADGTYDVRVDYSENFYGVFGGLNYVGCEEGAEVYANVPLGVSSGESAVQITMYADGQLLNCFEVGADNDLTWTEA